MFQPGKVLFLLLVLAWAGGRVSARPPTSSARIPMDGYAAIVDDTVITIGEVMAYMHPIEARLRDQFRGEELQQKLIEAFRKSRERLIEDALIVAEFRSRKIAIPEAMVDERVNAIINENFDDDRAAFLEALAAQRMSYEEMREQIKEGLIVMIMRRQEVVDRVHISPRQVFEEYERNRARFEEPGRVKLRTLAVQRGTNEQEQQAQREKIEEALRKAREGAAFDRLAREYSEEARAQRGGRWGWIDPDMLREELARAVNELETGEISDVVEVGDLMYIAWVEDRRPPSVIPLEQVRDDLEQAIRLREEERLYRKWINRLRDKFYVQILHE